MCWQCWLHLRPLASLCLHRTFPWPCLCPHFLSQGHPSYWIRALPKDLILTLSPPQRSCLQIWSHSRFLGLGLQHIILEGTVQAVARSRCLLCKAIPSGCRWEPGTPLRAPGFFSYMGNEAPRGLVVCKLTAKKMEGYFIWG